MKLTCFCCFFLLQQLQLISLVKAEGSFFHPLVQQFSKIAEEVGGRPFSIPKLEQKTRNIVSLAEEILGFPQVNTSASTSIIGASYLEGHAFYSIKYGQAPIEDLRFRPPVAAVVEGKVNASFPDYLRCFEFNRGCTEESCDKNYSEDCLVLNVFVPSTIDLSGPVTDLLPVMVYLYGGAFYVKADSEYYDDSRFLANITNTIVVTINYRVGPLGFLVYDEGDTKYEGNQGIKDQQLALKWVFDNIGKFGGDQNEITIFGQSAGAQSLTFHLLSEESKPYFKRAIMQSNPAAYYYPSKTEAEQKAQALLQALNCTEKNLECLKNASGLELVNAHLSVALTKPLNFFEIIEPYRPVIDDEFPEQPLDLFQAGRWQTDKEIIIGVTTEEGAYLSAALKNIAVDKSLFEAFTEFLVGSEFANAVIETYYEVAGNSANDTEFDYTDILAQEIGDMLFICPSKAIGRFMSSTSSTNPMHPAIYFYTFDHITEAPNCANFSNYCGYVYHAADIPYLFASGEQIGYEFTANDKAVEESINRFWGHFAHNGFPTSNTSVWPYYAQKAAVDNDQIGEWSNIRLTSPNTEVQNNFKTDLCEFWDSLGFYVNITDPTSTPAPKTDVSMTTPIGDTDSTTSGASRQQSSYLFVLVVFCLVWCIKQKT